MENVQLSFTQIHCPVMGMDQFAAICGVTKHVVEKWVRLGHVPSRKIGKRRLVDVLALSQQSASTPRVLTVPPLKPLVGVGK